MTNVTKKMGGGTGPLRRPHSRSTMLERVERMGLALGLPADECAGALQIMGAAGGARVEGVLRGLVLGSGSYVLSPWRGSRRSRFLNMKTS